MLQEKMDYDQISKKQNRTKQIWKSELWNLGRTADSWIAKWGIEAYNEDSIEKLGLKDLENGHQDA